MASPIVTGMVANLLSQGVEPCDVKASLIRMAAKNKITKSSLFLRKKTPNRILYNGINERDFESFDDED